MFSRIFRLLNVIVPSVIIDTSAERKKAKKEKRNYNKTREDKLERIS